MKLGRAQSGERLRGGFQTDVVRVGDTVRRRPGPNAAFVHELLAYLETAGWAGAPRLVGLDDEGREVLTFVEGDVPDPLRLPPWAAQEGALGAVLGLLRRLHDLTAGHPLAGAAEVVCHNDPAPRNVVFRNGTPHALIDWDHAAPGRRVTDVAFAVWQFHGYDPPSAELLDHMSARLARVGSVYGAPLDTGAVVQEMLRLQAANLATLTEKAAAGVPEFTAKATAGAIRWESAWHAWCVENEQALTTGARVD